jgi:hypothetical protein
MAFLDVEIVSTLALSAMQFCGKAEPFKRLISSQKMFIMTP